MLTITKQKVIEMALSKISVVQDIIDLTANEIELCLNTLDTTLYEWQALELIVLADPSGDFPTSDLSDEFSIEPYAIAPLAATVGLTLCSDFSKPVSPTLLREVTNGQRLVYRKTAKVPAERALPYGIPLGSGNINYEIWS
jgi:hypothetical protein